jgi:beta-N-acetylhexosaminidase
MNTNIGKHFVLGFETFSLPERLSELIRSFELFGLIFYKKNIRDNSQMKSLIDECNSIRKSSSNCRNKLIMSIDHEGGKVQRLKDGYTLIPPMREIGATKNPYEALETGRIIGAELKQTGFDLNYAPVLDVDSNPANPIIGDRSFSPDPVLCGQMGIALIQGMKEHNVSGCGKHFPGHGDSSKDSHLDLPVITADRDTIYNRELVPFRIAIQENLQFIMTSHCMYPSLDEKYPATMSYSILQKILREELGFKGLIITDDLYMKAMSDNFSVQDIVYRSIMASVDILLIAHMELQFEEYFSVMEKLFRDDSEFRARIEQSDRRIMDFFKQT